MGQIGSVYVPDELMPSIAAPETERPSLGAIFGANLEGTVRQAAAALPLQLETLRRAKVDPGTEQQYRRGLDQANAAFSRAPAASLDQAMSGEVGVGRFIAENLVASLPQMGAVIGGGVAGGIVGGPGGALVGATAVGSPLFSASNVARAVEENGSLSVDAAERSAAIAPFQAGGEALLGRFLPGAGRLLGPTAATQAGGFIARTAKSMVKAGATEAVTEAGQQFGERAAAGIELGSPDAIAEYINAGVTAFAVGGVLGAGGGFRRTNADAKAPEAVTNEDLIAKIDGNLDGSLRVSVPRVAPSAPIARGPDGRQLGLPAPPDLVVGPDGQTRVNPSGRVQLALPSPEMDGRSSRRETPPSLADVAVQDAAGRTIIVPDTGRSNIDPQAAALANLPRPATPPLDLGSIPDSFEGNFNPDLRAALDSILPPPAPLAASTSLSRGLDPAAFDQSTAPEPVVDLPENSFRPFKGESLADIDAAIKDSKSAPAMKAAAEAELAVRAREARGEVELTTENFQTRVDELKRGLRGGFVQQVTAADPAELADKVYDQIFVEQDTRANTAKFAQRLGILDENGAPGPMAAQVEARRAAAQAAAEAAPAPAAPTSAPLQRVGTVEPTEADTAEMQAAMKAAGIQRLSAATNGAQLRTPADVFAALTEPGATDQTSGTRARVTQVEKLARKLGLVTDDNAMDVTPKGRRVFLQSADGPAAVASAAADQGFVGAAAAQFDRGVQAAVAGQQTPPAFTNVEERAAYETGRVWADDFIQNGEVLTAARTQQTIAAQDEVKVARRGAIGQDQITPTPRAEGEAASRRQLTIEQRIAQGLNRLIDSADLSQARDTDVAILRRMVRDGATAAEVGAAIQNVQAGRTLFQEGPRQPIRESTPRPIVRGQPRRVEINTRTEAGRAALRAETEVPVRIFELRNLVQFALAEKAITKARADRLNAMLDKGDVKAVEKSMKNFLAEMNTGRATGIADPQFEQFVGDKDFMGVLDHMVAQAPSAYHRAIMDAVRSLAKRMEKQGVAFEFRVVRPGDEVPSALLPERTRALTIVSRNPAKSTVYLKSIEMGNGSGMNYQMAAHEMIHAVTMSLIQRGEQRGVLGVTNLGKAVEDLLKLQDAIYAHFTQRAEEGNLNEFEERFSRGMNNSLSNADEILAWGLTNPGMQKYLASIEYRPKQSLFGRFRELLGNLLGLEVKYNSALTELLRVAEQITEVGNAELAATFPRNNFRLTETGILMAAVDDAGVSAANRTVDAANEVTKQLASVADRVVEAITPDDLKVRSRRTMFGWMSHNQLDRMYGKIMGGLLKHSAANRERVAVRSRYEQMFDSVHQDYEKLERESPDMAKSLMELMATATEFQLDPDKPFDQHTHLGWAKDADGKMTVNPKQAAEVARLKPIYDSLIKRKNDLRRGNGAGWKVFTDMRALNEAQNYSRMAAQLHRLVATDPEFSLGVQDAAINPVDVFMRVEGLTEPAAIRDWWQKALNAQIGKVNEFITDKMGQAAATADQRDANAMRQYLAPIELEIDAAQEAMKAMRRAPYFHLGRFGNYFGSAVVAKTPDGIADPRAMAKLGQALAEAGFDDVQISTDNTRPRFMMRFETAEQMRAFEQLMVKLQKEGVISKEDEIKRGPRSSNQNFGVSDALPDSVARAIQSLEQHPMFVPDKDATPAERAAIEQNKQATIRAVLDTWLEQQPDSSISKVLVKRYNVVGYKKDMIRNAAHRWRVGSISLANVAAMPKFDAAYKDMQAQINDAVVVDPEQAGQAADPVLLSDLKREMQMRDAVAPVSEIADAYDKLRGYAHAYFLGMSPAYAMINMTQMGVVAMPELAKKHGYAKSFAAMRRSSGIAFKILKAAFAEAQQLGVKNRADVAITESVLQRAGLSSSEIQFALRMLATGTIDIGSAARSLGQIAEGGVGSKTDVALKYASAFGMYSETFSRLTTAFAARDLNKGTVETDSAYATQVVSDSMFDYQNWNTARQLGKKGFLGPVTPIVTQFMSYSAQLTEKLYSETVDAIGKQRPGETAEAAAARRKGAQKFMLGHITAVTALAGTMGLPFATAFAAVIERLVDAFDDDEEPYDATAAYRGFVADVFGTEVGEVISRGVPRALGFDISARAGEQNLLPFSEFLADRRPWKESLENYAGRGLGAVPSMISNVITGGGKMAEGDLMGGMKDMLPVAFKGPIETYRMTSEGYVDSRDNKLPMSPGASAYLWQLMGFSPAAKAEYSEARADQASRRGEIGRRSERLRQRIVKALIEGDRERATELITDAQKFDADNPAFAVIPSLAGSMQRQMTARSRAAALQTPLGVGLDDIAGQQLTNYANVGITQ